MARWMWATRICTSPNGRLVRRHHPETLLAVGAAVGLAGQLALLVLTRARRA
ncbi:hypothetical protein OG194_43265 [Streptomyces sp. NBC_01288]|uniref:hypothetical protein n=1 Tax=Streptomyces sp. NBC_01288 TaxID=2903814 RepID=UPI002E0FCD5B|nr:hypothetical protein OG194_43265 [Streptomyces sp. NBC_01288]